MDPTVRADGEPLPGRETHSGTHRQRQRRSERRPASPPFRLIHNLAVLRYRTLVRLAAVDPWMWLLLCTKYAAVISLHKVYSM